MLSDTLTYSENAPCFLHVTPGDRAKMQQGRPLNDIVPYGNVPTPAIAPYRGKYNGIFSTRKTFIEHVAVASEKRGGRKFPKDCLNVDTFEYGDIAFTFDDTWAFAERHDLTIHCEREDSQNIFAELKSIGIRASILTPCTVVADFPGPITIAEEPLGEVHFLPSFEEMAKMSIAERKRIEAEHKRIEKEYEKQMQWYEEIKKQRSRKRRQRRDAV